MQPPLNAGRRPLGIRRRGQTCALLARLTEDWFPGFMGLVKTTIELPDELVRRVKIRAVQEDRRLKDMVAVLLARGLEQPSPAGPASRVRLPLVHTAGAARPEEELTADRVATILLDADVSTTR